MSTSLQLNKFLVYRLVFLIVFMGYFKTGANESDSLFKVIEKMDQDSLKIEFLLSNASEIQNTNPDIAMELLLKAEGIAVNIENNFELARISYMKGELHYTKGNYREALFELFNSLDLHEKNENEKGIADTYNKIGSIYIYQGNYPNALDYFLKSLNIKVEINDTIGISNTYSNIGNIFYEQGNYEQALNYFFKSIEIDKIRNNEQGMAKTYMNIGTVYLSQGDYDNALEYNFKSLAVHEKNDDKQSIACCYSNIAIAFEEQGDFEKALINYKESLEIYNKIGAKQGIASTLYNIGYFYSMSGNYTKSIENLKESLKIAQEIGSLRDIVKISYALSDAFRAIGKFKEAYNYFIHYKLNNDKLNSEENIRKFTQLEMQYEFDKKQKEQEYIQHQKELAHQAEIKRRNIILVSLSFGILLLFLLVFIVYRNYRRKKRDNELLQKQKKEIEYQHDQISRQKQSITDSIHYAKRIQTALLPPDEIVNNLLPEYFILYEPRDIVSGDYYWISQKEEKVILVAADCTGHGVPGAFMSMLGISFLNEIVNKEIELKSDVILNELRNYVITSLRQTGQTGESKDGMDISLTIIDFAKNELQFSGAYNPLYIIKNSELNQIKADKMPIGISDKFHIPFSSHLIKLEKGDTFYMFSDGYVDQFGGPKGKNFMSKAFKKLLLEIQNESMSEQEKILNDTLCSWKGNNEQIDDILVVGFTI